MTLKSFLSGAGGNQALLIIVKVFSVLKHYNNLKYIFFFFWRFPFIVAFLTHNRCETLVIVSNVNGRKSDDLSGDSIWEVMSFCVVFLKY